MSTNFPVPSVNVISSVNWGTDAVAAQENIHANSAAMVDRLNADLKVRYLSRFNDYVINMESGNFIPDSQRTPPQPPFAWELAPPNEDGYVFYQVSATKLVCDMPPLPFYAFGNSGPNKDPNVFIIGRRDGNTNWFSALPGDTFPNGQTTPPTATSLDGVAGPFEKFGAPVGPGWYLKVG